MALSERRKGLRGQQEVQRLFQSLGIDLDKLAAQGDRVWHLPNGKTIRLEVKRRERLELKMWLRQGEEETPANMVSVVVFRQSGGKWYAALALEDLIGLVS